jgi:RNA polymerase sigma-70 factor, ECF subfamily
MSPAQRALVIEAGAAWQATGDALARPASRTARVSAPVGTCDERQLIERSQAGDRLAFEELVRRHADRLYGVVLRFVADADEAEEVTQETFLRAWRSIDRFERRSRFFTWLYRIGINEAKRRAERRPPGGAVGSIEDSPIEDAPDWSDAPEFRAEQGQLRGVLEDAVRALPLDYRTPLILRDVEGLSTQEAAEVMGLGEAAFKSRLHRARLAVRRAVDRYYLEAER